MTQTQPSLRQVAFIGNYVPRQCGIATFTTDLCQAVANEFAGVNCFALAVNDTPTGYNYRDTVRFELDEQDLTAYRRAADFLNVNNVDLVCLQHEYGIFGGKAGSHILALLSELRMPVVTTLHTILREPDPHQRQVLLELVRLSDRLVVMSQRGSEFLQDIYNVPPGKIDLIPHGIPDVPFVDPNFYKDQFGVEGKLVLLTFGLLSPNKGIEYVINALPGILSRFPNVVYIILGATHPHVKRHSGEEYRLSLQRLAHEHGVADHVIFHNRFVSLPELIEFIGAADVYLTPYLNEAQIVSGTLAYTLGAGKAIVSTPYWYAEELLADGRGVLVPFRDAEAIAERVIEFLDNEAERHAVRKRAYLFGREMIWSNVARLYMQSFGRARQERAEHLQPIFAAQTLKKRGSELPQINLAHLRRMTDSTGVLQHAIFTVPTYAEGYTTDDNARALVLMVLLEEQFGEMTGEIEDLASRYLAFLGYAFNESTGRFRNFMAYDRRWLDDVGSEDSHGRALWALGAVLGRSGHAGLRGLAGRIYDRALAATLEFTSPRAWASTLFAIHEYLRRFSGDRAAQNARQTLAERLMALYECTHGPEWPWFEDVASYANATLPHALLLSGYALNRPEMAQAGLAALDWLATIQTAVGGHFAPIGNQGFYRRGGEKARFDQQPIEAQTMVSACLEAGRLTGDRRWYEEAVRAFEWFLGRNDLGLPLYDSTTGGCRDGLHTDRTNRNQGAESTLSFLLALAEMTLQQHLLSPAPESPTAEASVPVPTATSLSCT
jgi:glycosyltransferase involved in cell wall biosynthesis